MLLLFFLTSSFTYDSAEEMAAAFADDTLDVNIYSRFSNPTVDEFIYKVAALEGAEDGIATGTGMAAIFSTFMTFLNNGDHIISASAVFGSTHTILTKYLPKWGIEYSYFDMSKPETIEALIKPNTKMLYVETPCNPGLDIIDIEWVSAFVSSIRFYLWSIIVLPLLPCNNPLNMVPTWYCILLPSLLTGRDEYWVE